MLIELFSLGVTAATLRAKRDRKSASSLQRGHFDTKFQVEGVIGVLLGVLGVLQHPMLLEKSEIFRLSEILTCRRSEIFITYLYKNALFFLQKMF